MGAWWNGHKVLALVIAATILLIAWMVRFEWADKYGFITETDSPALFGTIPTSAGSLSGDFDRPPLPAALISG